MTHTYDKIKIIHIITRFDKGGSAENTFLTVRGLDKGRYDVLLIKGAFSQESAGNLESDAVNANISAAREQNVRLICLNHLVRNIRFLSDGAAFISLLRTIGREKPHIVHTHTSKAGILGRWAAFFCSVPIIVHTPHGHVFWGYFGPWKTRLFILLERLTTSITTAIVTLTPQEKQDHLRFRIAPEHKFTVIHSGVDLEMFKANLLDRAEMKATLGIPTDVIVVGTVGRLTSVKGQDILLRTVAKLIRQGQKIFLVLLGDGELRQDLEQLASRLNLEGHVRFLGWRPDVAGIMATFDIFCLPSRNEGMGKVVVEAMAMAIPVIASDIGGIPDMVHQGDNGLLVPPDDIAAWEKAIIDLCQNAQRRRTMGEAGRQLAHRYGADEMVTKIDRLYGKLLSEQDRHGC
jgi:glycosyltransferase involved in cell wall biosynthesis